VTVSVSGIGVTLCLASLLAAHVGLFLGACSSRALVPPVPPPTCALACAPTTISPAWTPTSGPARVPPSPAPTWAAIPAPAATPPAKVSPATGPAPGPNRGGSVVAAPPAAAGPVTPVSTPAVARPRRAAAVSRDALFRQGSAFPPNRGKVAPVVSVIVLLVVVLIPCAAAAATRYRRLR
jgi:hypothetical protein